MGVDLIKIDYSGDPKSCLIENKFCIFSVTYCCGIFFPFNVINGMILPLFLLHFNLNIILPCYIYYVLLNCIVMVFYDIVIMWLSCDP